MTNIQIIPSTEYVSAYELPYGSLFTREGDPEPEVYLRVTDGAVSFCGEDQNGSPCVSLWTNAELTDGTRVWGKEIAFDKCRIVLGDINVTVKLF